LRQRVRSKLIDSRIASRKRERQAEEEIVVQAPQIEEVGFLQVSEEELTDGEKRRRLASALVMIGALMGVLSGTLILQGNPSGLLNSSIFKSTDSLDIHGFVLDEAGYPVANVSIELVDLDSGREINSSMSDENGRYVINSVLAKEYELHLMKEGYETVILSFVPEPIGISPITMVEGDGERYVDDYTKTEGWSLDNAVALATFEGLFTLGCALVGIHASFEIKRKKKYRRTQALCWVGLFSRGMIIFGPTLILAGMILVMLNKEDFADQQEMEGL
jgi:hypothetical protein